MLAQRHIETKTIADFAGDSAKFVRKVHSSKQPLLLTEEGEYTAVIIDSVEYDSIAERLQMLEDIYVSQEQLRSGKGIPHEVAEATILSRFT